jgi:hypothetical protein
MFRPFKAGRVLETWIAALRFAEGARRPSIEDLIRTRLVRGTSRGPFLDETARRGESIGSWTLFAQSALHARSAHDRQGERGFLLAAIRLAPRELSLFLALARLEWGSSSDLEIFALENALRLAGRWTRGEERLVEARDEIGEPETSRERRARWRCEEREWKALRVPNEESGADEKEAA